MGKGQKKSITDYASHTMYSGLRVSGFRDVLEMLKCLLPASMLNNPQTIKLTAW